MIDPDLTYARNSACLSAGGVRTAFTVPENVAAGLEGLKYYRDGGWVNDVNEAGERHGMGRGDTDVNGDTLQFQEGGYMFLSSTDEGMDSLKHTSKIRQSLGLPPSTIFSDPSSLSSAYPYLNVSDLKGGAVTEGDGWFDPYSFITSTMKLVKNLGVNVITGQVVQAKLEPEGTLTSVKVDPSEAGKTSFDVKGDYFVNAAGAGGGLLMDVFEMCATTSGVTALPSNSVPYPVKARKRSVFHIRSRGFPEVDVERIPLTVNTDGVWFRGVGKVEKGGDVEVICGCTPEVDPDLEYREDLLEPRWGEWEGRIWEVRGGGGGILH